MTPEQAEKHKPVIIWWLKNTGRGVWIRMCNSDVWYKSKNPTFEEFEVIVQNDEYAEFRKAQADGKVIQDDTGLDWSECRYLWDLPIERYRIKPDEPKFKVGNWLRTLPNKGHLTPAPIFKIEGCLTRYNVDAAELWQPQEGDVVVFWDNGDTRRTIQKLGRYFEHLADYDNVIPYIGQPFEDMI